ncbi:hypothetical protein SEPCBS57363_004890 [Sporothrix epigloea]|uniref:DNA methylase adenine-specific domain-containing protein n=1 Tax=Sporothrix epigloea TaxID=1892477 RepID=A0ABP0DXD9_9PEZI
MPRLPPSLFWRACRISPGTALLLPVCRDLPSALTELRWIQQHVRETAERKGQSSWERKRSVLALCQRRGRGEPLQYVLGTQPFGPLDLLCRKGVFIPRPEPEAYTLHLANLLLQESQQASLVQPGHPITILDACTGTGCIALLLYAQLWRQKEAVERGALHIVGLDMAPEAVKLARANAVRNALPMQTDGTETSSSIRFVQGDLFSDDWLDHDAIKHLLRSPLDVLVSNPPYISAKGFADDTARSVRLFEPKLAQVPQPTEHRIGNGAAEDVFYVRLLELASRLGARIVLCETGGLEQAKRVAALALDQTPILDLEIWADQPDIVDVDCPDRWVTVAGHQVRIKGSGHGRSVFIRRQ